MSKCLIEDGKKTRFSATKRCKRPSTSMKVLTQGTCKPDSMASHCLSSPLALTWLHHWFIVNFFRTNFIPNNISSLNFEKIFLVSLILNENYNCYFIIFKKKNSFIITRTKTHFKSALPKSKHMKVSKFSPEV